MPAPDRSAGVGSVALALAERVERTGGPRAGLLAWRALAAGTSDDHVRARALVAALRCALGLRDETALGELARRWTDVRGAHDAIHAVCIDLVDAGLVSAAITLASAEARRRPTARSLYLRARCLDVARDPGAVAALGEAALRAEGERAREVEAASRARLASLLSRSWETLGEALEHARRVDPTVLPPAWRLRFAEVLLLSPSRFVRAGALGILDDLVLGGDDVLAARALATAARWADAIGDGMTALEADRLAALFGRERAGALAPGGKDVAAMLLSGRFDPSLGRGPHACWQEVLEAAAGIREREPARAARALRSLADAAEAGEIVPPASLALAERALTFEDDEVRAAAVRIAAARLARVTPGAPPDGWLALADALAACGRTELAITARRAAVIAREPGATASLGTWLAREGWALAARGERDRAIATLSEAQKLLSGPPQRV